MIEKRFITQIGLGVDQHGHNDDCSRAAFKAIKNAIANNCLSGLIEMCGLKEAQDLNRMNVHVKIGAPFPEKINEKKVLDAIPLGQKALETVEGGLLVKGVQIGELGDTSDNIIVCNAAVSVSVIY
ncbi:MAG: hypothetical protein EU548_06670 [Promethearchaeota archaeon]|nr:MAG: hypothetical protein EU548_06670 [Candidatus Lokiarchaeota archaeon]